MTDKELTKRSAEERLTKHDFFEELRYYALLAAFVFLISLCLNRFFVFRSVVYGESMEGTLQDGDNLLVERVSYWFDATPDRYDIVILDIEDGLGTKYVKRIVGLPGETVWIQDGALYINGEKREDDPCIDHPMRYAGIASSPIVLKENEVFVLGDNRTNSKDSRYIGPVRLDQLSGKAILRFYPFSGFGGVK